MTELSERFGISRKTGYKWLNRFAKHGFDGLKERSRSAKHCPHRTDPKMVEQLVEHLVVARETQGFGMHAMDKWRTD